VRREFSGLADVEETVFTGQVVERDGEMGIVETTAGQFRARVPADTNDVYVTIRADTVTLHESEAAPAPGETSARNQFRGTVTSIKQGESIVAVNIDIGGEPDLSVLITDESRRKLQLQPGVEVTASVKSTATLATHREKL
jgi:molybdate transport system regulatory protein